MEAQRQIFHGVFRDHSFLYKAQNNCTNKQLAYLSDLWRMCDRPNILGAPHLSHISNQFTSKNCWI